MPNDETGQVPGNYNQWFITAPSRCAGTACAACVNGAPENFGWQIPFYDRAYIHTQPLTQIQDDNIMAAALICPPQIISTSAPE